MRTKANDLLYLVKRFTLGAIATYVALVLVGAPEMKSLAISLVIWITGGLLMWLYVYPLLPKSTNLKE